MQNISTGEVVAAYNFTSQTNNLVERVKRLELANWRWFPVWSSDRHRQMALASRGHFCCWPIAGRWKAHKVMLGFASENGTTQRRWMNECVGHIRYRRRLQNKREVCHGRWGHSGHAQKKQMKEDHSGNNEKDPKLAILELLAASPSLWPVWKMDVDGCAIKWRCKHRTWFA